VYKVNVHSFLTHDGKRIPYRICPTADPVQIIHEDDRVEEGYFVTSRELEVLRHDAFEAGKGSGDRLSFEEFNATRHAETTVTLEWLNQRRALRREAFRAGFQDNTKDPCGDKLDREDWEIAYEAWIERKAWGIE